MSKITRNYVYNICFQLVTLLTPLVLSPYLARTVGATGLGVYAYVCSASNIICTITLLGTYNYGCRQIAYVRDDKTATDEIYNQIFSIRILLGLVGTVVYAMYVLISRKYINVFVVYYLWFVSMIIDPSWFFVGEEDMKPTALKNILIKVVSVLLIFLFVKNDSHVVRYTLIMAGSALFANLMLYAQLKKYNIHHHFSMQGFKRHLKDSIPLFWPQVATLFYLQVDKVMLQYLHPDVKQISYYDYGEKIVTIPLAFITTLSVVMMPRIANEYSKHNVDQMKELLLKAGSFSLMLAFPMMAGLASCAGNLIPWYLGEEYLPSISVIILVSPIIVTNSLSGISGNQYLVATNQTKVLLKAYVSAAVLNIVVNSALIPFYGCRGAAIATVGSATVSVCIQYYYMNKQLGVKEFVHYGMRYALLSIPVVIVAMVIGMKLAAAPMTSLLQVCVGGVVYLILLLITKDPNLRLILNKIQHH